jgi:hypothetical protein
MPSQHPQYTTLRSLWQFEYQVAVVLTATRAKLAYHRERFAHWTKEFETIKASLPEAVKFINAEDFLRAASSNSTYGSPQMQIDPKVQQAGNQAVAKVSEHRGKVDIYERWERVLANQDDTRWLPLTFDDVEFFAIGPATATPETTDELDASDDA